MIKSLHDYVYNMYKPEIGNKRREIATPALILDLDVAKRNIKYMADCISKMPAELKPHIKVQKCTELAKMQIEAGAIGVCTATVWEAIVMSRAGIEDVYIANQIGGPAKIKALAQEAKHSRLSLAVDNKQNADNLSSAAVAAGSELGVLIEVDVGMGRRGRALS